LISSSAPSALPITPTSDDTADSAAPEAVSAALAASATSAGAAASPAARGVLGLSTRRAHELEELFSPQGALASHIEGYHARDSQRAMACAVAAAIEATGRLPEPQLLAPAGTRAASARAAEANGSHSIAAQDTHADDGSNTLIVEAGTGTGKTYAYLVPSMLWGGKVIVSTGTKHLQDQLFQRDIPTVRDALAVPVSVAMLKGRANYLCHYYLQRTADSGRLPSRQDAAHLQDVVRFAKITRTGDKAELASVPETAPIWPMVTSTRENCLGQECPNYKDCFVMQARREAQQADIVVVNHHLFFADIMLRDTGMAELLPSANTVIFDEAHQLPDTATLFFGTTLSTAQMLELARDCVAEGLVHARDACDWPQLGAKLERAARDIRLAFGQDTVRLSVSQLGDEHPLYESLEAVDAALDELAEILASQAERSDALGVCLRRARELQQTLASWSAPAAPESTAKSAASNRATYGAKSGAKSGDKGAEKGGQAESVNESVRWVEVFSHTVQLHQTPLSVAPIFAKQRSGAPRAWIFTSATLSVKGDFTHYAAQMGLDAKRSMTLASPFDYGTQALLYVPRELPQPSSPGFTDAVLDAALPVIEAAGGRAFLLCTTLRAVERIANRLRDVMDARGWTFPLLVQGDASRTELLDRFRSLGNAILVGSQSFWEGVDVRGEALSLVVIDKLPFAPPDDPVLAARLDALTKKGLSPFAVHQLPQAVITLKQGAGRLIRAETDRGVLMICDPRLVEKPYGKRIWQSLPAFKRTRELEVVRDFFASVQPPEGN
jgi:ATP-dependent DNA helicase DinG